MGVFVYCLLLPLVTGVVCHVTMATTVLGNNILNCIDYSSWKSLQNTHNLGYAFNMTTWSCTSVSPSPMSATVKIYFLCS